MTAYTIVSKIYMCVRICTLFRGLSWGLKGAVQKMNDISMWGAMGISCTSRQAWTLHSSYPHKKSLLTSASLSFLTHSTGIRSHSCLISSGDFEDVVNLLHHV